MKRKSRRLLALLLATSMTFAMTACGGEATNGENANKDVEVAADYFNKEGYPICDEPITITMGGYAKTEDWDNTYAAQYWKNNLGIITDSTPINSKETLKTQYALMIAENKLPDVMIGIDEDTVGKAQVNIDGGAGYWLDFTEYLEYMPNLVAFWEKYPQMKAYDCTEDGACYSLNRITPGVYANVGGQIYYDRKAVEAVYPDPIETIDDFYDALVAVQEAYPDRKPFSISYNNMNSLRADVIIQNAFGLESRAREYMLYEDENGEVVLGDTTENYRAYLDFMRKLYDEKLLDNDCFVTSQDEYSASQKNGDYVFWGGNALVGAKFSNNFADYGAIGALKSDWNEEGTFVLASGIAQGARVCVSADTKYPEAICRLIDFWFTEEGCTMNRNGVEGVHWDYVCTNDYGVETRKFDDRFAAYKEAHPDEEYENSSVWQQQHIYIYMQTYFEGAPNFADEFDDATLEEILEIGKTNPEKVTGLMAPALAVLAARKAGKLVNEPLPQRYTNAETKEVATLKADISNYISTFKADAIRGVKDTLNDADWNEYISTLERMGLERLMEIETAAFRRAGN